MIPLVIHRLAAAAIVESGEFTFINQSLDADPHEEAAWLELAREMTRTSFGARVKAHFVVELTLDQARALFHRVERLVGTVTDRAVKRQLKRLLNQKNVVDA